MLFKGELSTWRNNFQHLNQTALKSRFCHYLPAKYIEVAARIDAHYRYRGGLEYMLFFRTKKEVVQTIVARGGDDYHFGVELGGAGNRLSVNLETVFGCLYNRVFNPILEV